jgi:phytoene desaturase
MKKKVVIIGSGFGGLSAAALLAKEGYDVTVLEKHDQVGGRARIFKAGGFSFDMGPSWYLMPDIFETFFAHFNKKPEDYYGLTRLDPSYKVIYKDGAEMNVPADLEEVYALFESLEEGGAEKIKEYLKISEYQYAVSVNEFLYKRYKSIFDFFNARLVLEGTKLKVFQSVDAFVSRFFKSPEAKNLLQYNMVFLGADPRRAPAIYALMTYVDLVLGVWYPEGGLNGVARGMEQLAREHGVSFEFNADVEAIEVENGVATGVRVGDTLHKADIVISNADYHHTETQLLDDQFQTYPEKYWKKRVLAPSGFILYLGLDKKLPHLEHHTLILHKDMNPHFDAVFKEKKWPEDPSYYICMPSKHDSSVAPEGKENLFILVPVASELQDDEVFREKYATEIIKDLEKITGEEIEKHLEVRRIYSQKDFASDYYALKGTALGLSHTLFQTALFRPDIQSKKVSNLYYTGQYTHPGIGVPMTVIASEILVKEIQKNNA